MHSSHQRQIQKVKMLRHRLSELEAQRVEANTPAPSKVYQEFMEVIFQLEKAEEQLLQSAQNIYDKTRQTNALIVATRHKFVDLKKKMQLNEELFMVNVLRPARKLMLAIQQREFLEEQYQRIITNIKQERYASHDELEMDVLRILDQEKSLSSQSAQENEKNEKDNPLPPLASLMDLTTEDVEEAISMTSVLEDFKKIVLPAVHPDTSLASPEEFHSAYQVLQDRDFLLMKAYIAEYKQPEDFNKDMDPVRNMEEQSQLLHETQKTLSALEKRYQKLEEDVTEQELVDPEELKNNLQQRREDILARIHEESEQILAIREKLEALLF